MKEKKYSLRKYSVGLVSAVVGLGVVAGPVAHAAETGAEQPEKVETLKPVEKEDAKKLLEEAEARAVNGTPKATEQPKNTDEKKQPENVEAATISVTVKENATKADIEKAIKEEWAKVDGGKRELNEINGVPATATADFTATAKVDRPNFPADKIQPDEKENTININVTVDTPAKESDFEQEGDENYVYLPVSKVDENADEATLEKAAKEDEEGYKAATKEAVKKAEDYVKSVQEALGKDLKNLEVKGTIKSGNIAESSTKDSLLAKVTVTVTDKTTKATEEKEVVIELVPYTESFNDTPLVAFNGETFLGNFIKDLIQTYKADKVEVPENVTIADASKPLEVTVKTADGKEVKVEVPIIKVGKLSPKTVVYSKYDLQGEEVGKNDPKALFKAAEEAVLEALAADKDLMESSKETADKGAYITGTDVEAESVDENGNVVVRVEYTLAFQNPLTGYDEFATFEKRVLVPTKRESLTKTYVPFKVLADGQGKKAKVKITIDGEGSFVLETDENGMVTVPAEEWDSLEYEVIEVPAGYKAPKAKKYVAHAGTNNEIEIELTKVETPENPREIHPGQPGSTPAPTSTMKEEVKKEGRTLPNTTSTAATTAALALGLGVLALALRRRVK